MSDRVVSATSLGARMQRVRADAGARLIDAFFRSLSSVARLHPSADPARHGVEVLRDVAYLDDGSAEHRLDVWRPCESAGPRPVVLYLHGGGFRILSKDTHWLMGLAFARRGFVVFNANYRLGPRHPFPAAIEDASRAYAWVVGNAARFGGDPSRIVLAGESAGANLATAVALSTAYQRPEPYARDVFALDVRPIAVLPACGILQVSDVERFARRRPLPAFVRDRLVEVRDAYLGPVASRDAGTMDLADPLCVLERGEAPARPLPPFFAAAGTRDPLLDDTRRLASALQRLGVSCRVTYYPGEMHAFHAFIWRRSAVAYWRESFEFLDQCLAPLAAGAAS